MENSAAQVKVKRPIQLKFTLPLLAVLAVLVLFLFFRFGGKDAGPSITGDLLGQKLQAVQDLVSVEYHYTNMGKFEDQTDFYGWKVPFTTKRFIVSYDGVILAGVDLEEARVEVDQQAKRITVTLPPSRILSHQIPEDSIQVFDETRNIFNPITIGDYTGFTKEQKGAVEEKALQNGLLTAADEKAAQAVEDLLGLMAEGYSIEVKNEK